MCVTVKKDNGQQFFYNFALSFKNFIAMEKAHNPNSIQFAQSM